ncbi:O-antigen ligase family protein [Paenibacillaceae bacterium WGS1546]|uniref:O-antigen ligase family protein n=1 Tax=Cohnella sp. WGS1546 TaxID=3366810 RepID=UPI00372D721D
MNWLLIAILTCLFVIAPFQRGLFFDSDMYIFEALILIAFLIWLIASIFTKSIRVPAVYYTVFLIPFTYILTFIVAESPKGNFDNLLRWLTYCSLFILLISIRRQLNGERALRLVFQVSGIVLVGFSFLGLMGLVEYKDIILGNRLTGPFQYANTFAAVIGAYWLYSLVMLVRERQHLTSMLLYSLPLIAYGTSFFASYSRGGYLVFPIAWLLGLVFLKFREQLLYLMYSLIAVSGSFITFRLVADTERSGDASVWIAFTGFSFLVALVALALSGGKSQSLLNRISANHWLGRFGKIAICSTTLLLGLLLGLDLSQKGLVFRTLPEALQSRVEQVNLGTLGRTGMFEDAFAFSNQLPLLGFGGDGWKTVYLNMQSKPYYSNEIHNGYLEMLLSTGWVGLLLFVAVFALLVVAMLRYRRSLNDGSERIAWLAPAVGACMIFVHAAIDFDFSFGSVWFILMWLLSLGVSPHSDLLISSRLNKLLQRNARHYVQVGGTVLLASFVLFGIVYSIRFASAEKSIVIQRENTNIYEAIERFEDAGRKNPYHTDALLSLANFYLQLYNHNSDEGTKEKLLSLLETLEQLEPNNAKVIFNVGLKHGQLNDWIKGLPYLDRAIALDRYNVEYYNIIFDLKLQLAQQAAANGDQASGRKIARSAVEDYKTYTQWFDQFSGEAIPDRRPINLSKWGYVAAARTHLFLDEPNEAYELLQRYRVSVDNDLINERNELTEESFKIAILDDFIRSYSNQIIIISVKDEATANLSTGFRELLAQMGSGIKELEYRGSYAAIISDGVVIGEKIDNSSSVTIEQDEFQSVSELFIGRELKVFSAGNPYGNRSSILLDGTEYSENLRGINIAVFSKELEPIAKINFDTHRSEVKVMKEVD